MNSENDLMLETDRLDELLEVPAQAQPVIVVQYRNRGVPFSVFFPMIFIVPLALIVVYHRMVAERYYVQAAQANSLLVQEIKVDRASLPLVSNDTPPSTILPGSRTPASTYDADHDRSIDADPVPAKASSAALTATTVDPEKAHASSAGTPELPPKRSTAVSQTLPVNEDHKPVAQAVPPPATLESPPETSTKKPSITLRSVLPNPFADGAVSPRPPTPGGDFGSAEDAKKPLNTSAVPAQALVDRSAGVEPGNQDPRDADEKAPAGPATPATGRSAVAAPLERLPTKEEFQREIEDEAARKTAEIAAQNEGNSVDLRTQRLEEQARFRQELREVLRSEGSAAGPEIDSLAKRYGYDLPREKYAKAHRVWRYTRSSQQDKVRLIRELELPETVILDFLSDDIHPKIMSRNGPRNESEVRVFAARQLLRYPFPDPGAALRPAAGNPSAAVPPVGSQSPRRKTVVSTPR